MVPEQDRSASSHVSDLHTRLDKHILPVLGSYKLDRISVASIEKLRNELRDRKYARRTINCILRIVGSVFSLAIKRGLCSKNPVNSVERAQQASVEKAVSISMRSKPWAA